MLDRRDLTPAGRWLQRGDGGPAASLGDAYDAVSEDWATGASRVYEPLSTVLVAAAPAPMKGARVLDLGAGTGATTKALLASGAEVVALDRAVGMLRHCRGWRPPGVAGDARALPFRPAVFDAVVAAFSLSHVSEPVAALAEAARVTRSGGVVLAGVFGARRDHPAKARVEAVAADHGYRRPAWYERFKREVEPLTAEPAALAAVARAAGLVDVAVVGRDVDLGFLSPAELVAWRLATPALAAFVASLERCRRSALVAAAEAAVGPDPQPGRAAILILSSRTAA